MTLDRSRAVPLAVEEAVRSFNLLTVTLALDSDAQLTHVATIGAAVFRTGIDAGLDARDMVIRISPGLQELRAARDRFGLTASDGLTALLSFQAVVASNAPLEQVATQATTVLATLARNGARTRAAGRR